MCGFTQPIKLVALRVPFICETNQFETLLNCLRHILIEANIGMVQFCSIECSLRLEGAMPEKDFDLPTALHMPWRSGQ